MNPIQDVCRQCTTVPGSGGRLRALPRLQLDNILFSMSQRLAALLQSHGGKPASDPAWVIDLGYAYFALGGGERAQIEIL